ncbi:hypothetical protein Tco_0634391, partial [Tanacetum coccineum]
NQWIWPSDWFVKYPILATVNAPSLMLDVSDSLEWRVLGSPKPFSVLTVKESIRPRGDDVLWHDVV